MRRPLLNLVVATVAVISLIACDDPGSVPAEDTSVDTVPVDADLALRAALDRHGVIAPAPAEPQNPDAVAVGRLLFFDAELSGNRDVSCATCHHPNHGTSDGLRLSVGTLGVGLGPDRQLAAGREPTPRNANDLFNRGLPGVETMFWDGRVAGNYEAGFTQPRFDDVPLPAGLESALAAQAMFPPTSRVEMLGRSGERDVHGDENEVAVLRADHLDEIWDALYARIDAIPAYREALAAAYPELASDERSFVEVANALAAFMTDAFSTLDTPFDRYLAGDDDALTEAQKRGALLFYGEANCASCHSGGLLTDDDFHNIAVPQFGPGKGSEAPYDFGRGRETGAVTDRFAFRTPALRNVELTGPWMHNGAYTELRDAVVHHLDCAAALAAWDEELPPEIDDQIVGAETAAARLRATMDEGMSAPIVLAETEIDDLMRFLSALTDPAALDLDDLIPDEVPSGLPVPR